MFEQIGSNLKYEISPITDGVIFFNSIDFYQRNNLKNTFLVHKTRLKEVLKTKLLDNFNYY